MGFKTSFITLPYVKEKIKIHLYMTLMIIILNMHNITSLYVLGELDVFNPPSGNLGACPYPFKVFTIEWRQGLFNS